MDESTLGFIFALIFAFAIFLLINAGLLMLACRLAGVRVPAFGRAALIVIVALAANIVAGVLLAIILGLALRGQAIQQDPLAFTIVTQSVSLLVGLFINAWVYSLMLPTSYIKGMIIYVIQIAIMFAISVTIAMAIMLAMRLLR